ncbi:MAG: hypothetical protein QG635_196 [Bacteroidota bacterium]|nr:hypothetical protein [Bacteroidota bacterium]
MKNLLLLMFCLYARMFAGQNYLYEPEEQSIMQIKKGTVKITDKIYKSDDFKIRYGQKTIRKTIDFKMNLDSLTLLELRMLKYSLYAQKGYLFDDAVIRDYFNSDSLYQPVYWIKNLDFSLNSDEDAFYRKIKLKENSLQKMQAVSDKFDLSSISNSSQIDLSNKDFAEKLQKNGYAVVPKNNIELYITYEINKYSHFPSFVTTDFYLQLIHLYFLHVLTTLEEDNFIPLVRDISKKMYDLSINNKKEDIEDRSKNAAGFSQFYFAVAYELLTGERLKIQKVFEKDRKELIEIIYSANGEYVSVLLGDTIDCSLFKPRGNYIRTKALQRYFRAMMWLGKVPFIIQDYDQFNRAKYIAKLLTNNPDLFDKYSKISDILAFMIGRPDNLSIKDLYNSLTTDDKSTIEKLSKFNHEQIIEQGRLADRRIMLNFFPQLYTPDAYIMSKMIHLSMDSERREYPRALDVFAAFGNRPAEDILLNHYKEALKWHHFSDTLNMLKNKFANYNFHENIYGYWLSALNIIFNKNENYPLVMRSSSWDLKNLNTALASFSALKHDAILYAEQPTAAECGDGDTPYELPPEPTQVGYVEPNIDFWQAGIDLINQLDSKLNKYKITNKNYYNCQKTISELNKFLLDISKKELKGITLSSNEYSRIERIGSEFEYLKEEFANPVEEEKMPVDKWSPRTINDDEMAVVADVYSISNGSSSNCLELGVGRADDIYCIVDIGGYYYLTRGAVYSFYEFHQPISNRLTDKEWRVMLDSEIPPARESWYEKVLCPGRQIDIKEMKVNPVSFIEYHEEDENK